MTNSMVVLCLIATSALPVVPELSGRIVGGSDAPHGEYPYQISLRRNGRHICGGSIVAKKYVITAAHCVIRSFPSDLSIVVGTNKLSGGGTIYDVLDAYYHEEYDSVARKNDVAILKVEPISYSHNVGPIAVETDHVGGGEDVTLSGWGRLRLRGRSPEYLQHIELKTTTSKHCKSKHKNPSVSGQQICTVTEIGEGACHGDSGGPLVRTIGGQKKLVGIVSWGKPCARGVPDVYARVSHFVDWFNDKCNNCL